MKGDHISNVLSNIGPSHLARFYAGVGMGGGFGAAYGPGRTPLNSHDISVSALYFALDNIVLPDVTTDHPDWSYEDRREETIRRIELRSGDNLRRGYLPELDREGVMTTEWDVVETASGKKMATWNGDKYTTREELWDNFEKYAKSRSEWTEAFEREKIAQQQMESAVVRGDAKGAATWLSHESNLARYLQVWEKESDGRIVSKQYDVGVIVGRDITQQEANRVMGNISKMYAKSSVTENTSYPHVVSKEAIHIHSVSLVDGKQTVFPKEVQVSHRVSETSHLKNRIDDQLFRQNAPFDFIRDVGDQVLKNTKETVVSIGSFLERRKADKGENLRFSEPRRSGTRDIVERVRRLFGRDDVDGHEGKRQQGRLTLEKIREKPEKLVEAIETRHAEMRKSVAALLVVAETKVAIGAAPLLLAALAKEQPKPIDAAMKSTRRHERKVRKVREVRNVREGKKKVVKPEFVRKEKEGKKKKGRMVYMREAAVGRIYTKRAVAEKKLPIMIERWERKRKKRIGRVIKRAEQAVEVKQVPNKEKKLWVALAVTGAEFTRVPRREKRERAVAGITFACVLWMLFHEDAKRRGYHIHNDDKIVPKQERTKVLDHNPTPWILLSIIYYLTAIREQRIHNYPIIQLSNTTNTTNTTNVLPTYGVIFAFAS